MAAEAAPPEALVGSAFQISVNSNHERSADIAYDVVNDRFMVVWQIDSPGVGGLAGAIYSSDGTRVIGPISITFEAGAQRPRVAFAPASGYFVVWENTNLNSGDILGRGVGAGGVSFGNILNICGSNAGPQAFADVTATGLSSFLVVWQDGRNGTDAEIYSQPLLGGVPFVPANIRLTANSLPDQFPAIAAGFGGKSFLVWQRGNSTALLPNVPIMGELLYPDGTAATGEAPIGVGVYQGLLPAIAFDPDRNCFLAVWEAGWTPLFDHDIVGALIAVNFVGNSFQWLNGVVVDSLYREYAPDVAYDDANDRYLVVWQSDRNNSGDWDIQGRYILPDLGPAGAFEPIATDVGIDQRSPAIAFGTAADEFWVVWEDNRPVAILNIWGQRVKFAPPVVAVTAPNGGEQWQVGTPHDITWTSSGGVGTTVSIELLRGGVLDSTIAASTDNDGSLAWDIPAGQTPGNTYRVRVNDGVTTATDTSDADFSIVAPQPLQLTAPNGGEQWQVGTVHTITWTGDSCADVRLELWRGGSADSTIVASTPNDGSYAWSIPAGQTPANDYRVRVICTTDGANFDESDANFRLVTTPTPTITVTAPNGGEQWVRGFLQTITWTSSAGVGNSVNIDLLKGGTPVAQIAAPTPNTGQFSWVVPVSQTLGSDYRVRITDASAPGVSDESDADFAIVDQTISLTVLAPNGGELWARGSTQQIVWSPGSAGALVNIELFRAVTKVRDIAAPTQNTGTYDWAIPMDVVSANDYLIRVASTGNPSEVDSSNRFFTIDGTVSLRVISPNGGESWQAGSNQVITWLPDDSVSVRIQLLKAGAIQSVIATTTPNEGSFAWTVPGNQPGGSDYRVKVLSTIDPGKADESDANFTIVEIPKPDLAIEGFDFSPQDVNGGDPIDVSGRIVNTGSGDVTSSFWVEFRVSEQIDFSEPRLFLTESVNIGGPIAAGGSFDLSPLDLTVRTVAEGLPEGVYVVGIIVDPLGEVTESNETNNMTWLPRKKIFVGPRPTSARRWGQYR